MPNRRTDAGTHGNWWDGVAQPSRAVAAFTGQVGRRRHLGAGTTTLSDARLTELTRRNKTHVVPGGPGRLRVPAEELRHLVSAEWEWTLVRGLRRAAPVGVPTSHHVQRAAPGGFANRADPWTAAQRGVARDRGMARPTGRAPLAHRASSPALTVWALRIPRRGRGVSRVRHAQHGRWCRGFRPDAGARFALTPAIAPSHPPAQRCSPRSSARLSRWCGCTRTA